MPKPVAAERKAVPRSCAATLMLWAMGIDVRKHMTERTYWRHRQVLRGCGYDLSRSFVEGDYPEGLLISAGGFDLSAFDGQTLDVAMAEADLRNGVVPGPRLELV